MVRADNVSIALLLAHSCHLHKSSYVIKACTAISIDYSNESVQLTALTGGPFRLQAFLKEYVAKASLEIAISQPKNMYTISQINHTQSSLKEDEFVSSAVCC